MRRLHYRTNHRFRNGPLQRLLQWISDPCGADPQIGSYRIRPSGTPSLPAAAKGSGDFRHLAGRSVPALDQLGALPPSGGLPDPDPRDLGGGRETSSRPSGVPGRVGRGRPAAPVDRVQPGRRPVPVDPVQQACRMGPGGSPGLAFVWVGRMRIPDRHHGDHRDPIDLPGPESGQPVPDCEGYPANLLVCCFVPRFAGNRRWFPAPVPD